VPEHCCPQLADAVADPDVPVEYTDRFREYGIRILDGGSSVLRITHCPWGGCELPASLRHEWFDAIAAMGLSPRDEGIPEEYRTGEWWRRRERPDR
jgi:hypothetical protein